MTTRADLIWIEYIQMYKDTSDRIEIIEQHQIMLSDLVRSCRD